MAKKKYRIHNGGKYNKSLIQRENIFLMLNEKVIKDTGEAHGHDPPCQYQVTLIEILLNLNAMFHMNAGQNA